MKISRVSEMRHMDTTAIEQFGIPESLLMENAGHAAYTVLARELDIDRHRVLVVCGLGNNGGDGLVVARKLHSRGAALKVCLLGDAARFRGAARLNYDILARLPVDVERIESIDAFVRELPHYDAIVDALFGTGLRREVEGLYAEVITALNASGKPVLSLDIPSGVHGDTGQIMGVAVRASCTVTFGLPKVGNMLFPGYGLCGTLYVSHIAFPVGLYTAETLRIALNRPPKLPPRVAQAHKGTFGQVLCIAGAASYFGAPYFAALAVLKAGGGYVRLAAPASMIPFLATKGSEIVCVPQRETAAGSLALANGQALLELAERMDLVILGPGLSLHEETQQLVRTLAGAIRCPLLVDGDGLTALCQDLDLLVRRPAATVLTPHLGEMSRLTGLSIADIEANQIDVLQRTARQLQALIVLKGAHSLIGSPDGQVFINMSGNPGMATAGAGDVLNGTIAAMHGLGLGMQEAVCKGVFVHGMAGDLAAARQGEDGMTAQDILEALPRAMQLERRGLPAALRERYAGVRVV